MVAVIKTGHSIHRTLNYNENKVKEGVAQCIAAVNYPKDVSQLTLLNKLNRLLNQAALNENVTRNSVHISLNFDPSENLPHARLGEIVDAYMNKIGFGKQPYLVYQHRDAGHPHIHIATIKVRADGSRIDTQNIGRNQSEKARKEVEKAFGLAKAEGSTLQQAYRLKPISAERVQYGKSDTRRAITNVLDAVLNTYRYTSLHELNAVLRGYNVVADRGAENSRVYQNNGLVYRILDEKGNKIGVPVKASNLYNKPTLKYLLAKFAENETIRQAYKVRIKNAIDLALLKNPNHSVQTLGTLLEKEGINSVLRQNENGIIYGITYVDHRTKCVFNGSDLGKQYSANGIQERCKPIAPLQLIPVLQQQLTKQGEAEKHGTKEELRPAMGQAAAITVPKIVGEFLQPAQSNDYLPHQLKKTKKKKRKHTSNDL